MTREERAAQIWALLVFAALHRQTLTYERLSHLTGVPQQGLGPNLDPIQRYCLDNDLPPLTSLVVSKGTGVPEHGFSAAGDVPRAQAEVYGYDWLSVQAPRVEDFKPHA